MESVEEKKYRTTRNGFRISPKYQKPEDTGNILIKSVASLAIYLIAGYFFFPSYKILLLVTLVVLIHEMGHFLAMRFYGYNDLGVFFIPLLGAYVSGHKRKYLSSSLPLSYWRAHCPVFLSG